MSNMLDMHNMIQHELKDMVNNPPHYKRYPVECIQITEHMNFCLGNAVKYVYRAGDKGDAVTDLQKAIWYINREIERIQNAKK